MGLALMKRLRLEDIHVGDYVKIEDLDEIYDTMIVVEFESCEDSGGIIRYIGTPSWESTRIIKACKIVCPIYHNSFEIEDGVTYDE